eukprot:833883-Pyramimonas_sp.AAC.1
MQRRKSQTLMLQMMKLAGVPIMIMSLIAQVMARRHFDISESVDWTELFSGKQAVTDAMLAKGLTAVPFEIKKDEIYQNIMHFAGFCYAALLVVKTRPGGGQNSAPACSTWVWLSRGSTKRKSWSPLGGRSLPCVAEANTVVSRLMALCWVLISKGIHALSCAPPTFE